MCGLVCIISKRNYGFVHQDMTVFEQLLYADALRGDDSTGIIGVDKWGDMYVDKSRDDARDFLIQYVGSKSHKDMVQHGVALIGHNRKATMGTIADETAHPFVVDDNFAMVHNGTLYNHRALKDTAVDSEALAHHIATSLRQDNFDLIKFGEDMGEVSGAYACIWYDQLRDQVQMIRNDQRPLWIAEDDDSWYLASEGSMLHWILTRNGIKYKTLKTTEKETLYTFKPGTKIPAKEEVITVKKATPTPTNTSGVGTECGNKTTNLGEDNLSLNTLSKQQFKRLRKDITNRKINFWAEDYVERSLFTQDETDNNKDFLILGLTDDIRANHRLRAVINLDTLGILAADNIDSFLYTGVIKLVEFDSRDKCLIIHMENVSIVPASYTGKTDEKTAVTIH